MLATKMLPMKESCETEILPFAMMSVRSKVKVCPSVNLRLAFMTKSTLSVSIRSTMMDPLGTYMLFETVRTLQVRLPDKLAVLPIKTLPTVRFQFSTVSLLALKLLARGFPKTLRMLAKRDGPLALREFVVSALAIDRTFAETLPAIVAFCGTYVQNVSIELSITR